MAETQAPCAFCGIPGRAVVICLTHGPYATYVTQCGGCSAQGPSAGSQAGAWERWAWREQFTWGACAHCQVAFRRRHRLHQYCGEWCQRRAATARHRETA